MNKRHCPVFVSKKNRGNAALHGPGSSRRWQTSFILERSFSACTSTIRWKLRVQGNHVICRVKFALEPLDDSDYGHRHEATIGIKLVSIPYPFPCSVVGWQLSCMYEVYLTSLPETSYKLHLITMIIPRFWLFDQLRAIIKWRIFTGGSTFLSPLVDDNNGDEEVRHNGYYPLIINQYVPLIFAPFIA